MTQDQHPEYVGIYFLVGRPTPPLYGFVWRIWSGGTSFYVKPRWNGLAGFKISLHGPDPRPGMKPLLKLDHDGTAPKSHYSVEEPNGFLPCHFPGRPVGNGLTHVVRIAVPGDTFTHKAARFGPPAGNVGSKMQARYIDIPRPDSFAALDLYLGNGSATWPGRAKAEAQNAIVGELVNNAGQCLIGLTSHQRLKDEPLPTLLREFDAGPDETEVTRGISAALDPRGFVWLCERLMSEPLLAERESAI